MPRRLPTLLLLPLLAAACAGDPMERPGTFQPRGLNDANLRAMVADPAHLRRGAEAHTARGAAAAEAVERLHSGKTRETSLGQESKGAQMNLGGAQDAGR